MSKSLGLRNALTSGVLTTEIGWQEGTRLRPDAEHIARMKKKVQKRLYAWSITNEDGAARRHVNRMRQCRPQQRCQMGGCCHCEAQAQQNVVSWLTPALSGALFKGFKPAALHFVHDLGDIPHAMLNANRVASGAVACAKVTAAIRRAAREAGVTEFIFGLDICLCSDTRPNAPPPYWNVHAHGILEHNDARKLARALNRRFHPTLKSFQPVMVKVLDGRLAAAAYIFKRLTDRSAPLLRHTIPASATDRGNQRTRHLPLNLSDYAELNKFLSKLTLEGRLIVPDHVLKNESSIEIFKNRRR